MINVSVRERRGRIELQTHREGHMKTEAEIGVTVSGAKESQESPESGRGKGYSLLDLQRKYGWLCPQTDFTRNQNFRTRELPESAPRV